MKPKRIQRKRTKGWKMPPNTVYVGRPSKWGNPFMLGKLGPGSLVAATNLQAVGFYRKFYFPKDIKWFKEMVIEELKGKDLACWCALDEPCHADVLLKVANS